MKKDVTRDYTTEVFRTYAAAGAPSYAAARMSVYETELLKRRELEPSLAIEQAEIATEKQTPYLLDIMAAHKTFELLERGGKAHIIAAVKAVYFVCPRQPLRRGDTTERVRRFAVACPTDERTVYRWLKEARLLCAAIRGLRITEADMGKYLIAL
mgnify:CR=1 FL=1|jgi:hypothetical protein